MSVDLLKILNGVAPVPLEVQSHIADILQYKTLRKKEYILKPGQINDIMVFIQRGLMRAYYIKDGVEIGSWFRAEGEFIVSMVIRARVVKARTVQSERLKGFDGVYCNARMPEQTLEEYCLLDTHARRYLFGRLDCALVSARSYSRILKVSRTIADLAGSSTVEVEHVAEAVHFRGLERLVEGGRRRLQRGSRLAKMLSVLCHLLSQHFHIGTDLIFQHFCVDLGSCHFRMPQDLADRFDRYSVR